MVRPGTSSFTDSDPGRFGEAGAMTSAEPDTITARERARSRRDVANLLAVAALLAIGVGYLAMFSVLGDSNYAVKFENGYLPPGFDA